MSSISSSSRRCCSWCTPRSIPRSSRPRRAPCLPPQPRLGCCAGGCRGADAALSLHQALIQILRLCVGGVFDPANRAARVAGPAGKGRRSAGFVTLDAYLRETEKAVRAVFTRLVGEGGVATPLPPAKAGGQELRICFADEGGTTWIPAFAGKAELLRCRAVRLGRRGRQRQAHGYDRAAAFRRAYAHRAAVERRLGRGDGETQAGAAVVLGELVRNLLERPAEFVSAPRGEWPIPESETEKVAASPTARTRNADAAAGWA